MQGGLPSLCPVFFTQVYSAVFSIMTLWKETVSPLVRLYRGHHHSSTEQARLTRQTDTRRLLLVRFQVRFNLVYGHVLYAISCICELFGAIVHSDMVFVAVAVTRRTAEFSSTPWLKACVGSVGPGPPLFAQVTLFKRIWHRCCASEPAGGSLSNVRSNWFGHVRLKCCGAPPGYVLDKSRAAMRGGKGL